MAENVLVLKKKAVKAGMDKKEAMKATRAQLEEFLSGSSKPKAAKKTKKSATKKAAVKKSPAAKKKSTKKTKPAAAAPKKTKKSKKSSEGGRNMIDNLDFTNLEGWNPREDSPVNAIFKALKKFKGNVDKATDFLLPNAKDYVSTKKQNGDKRTKDEMRDLLRYRVNRTKWEFATRTGQHEASENRIEYGTGDFAQASKKGKRKTAKPKVSTKKTTKKSTKKKTAKKK